MKILETFASLEEVNNFSQKIKDDLQQGQWFHYSRIMVIKRESTKVENAGVFALASINIFERIYHAVMNFFMSCCCATLQDFKTTIISTEDLPLSSEKTANAGKSIQSVLPTSQPSKLVNTYGLEFYVSNYLDGDVLKLHLIYGGTLADPAKLEAVRKNMTAQLKPGSKVGGLEVLEISARTKSTKQLRDDLKLPADYVGYAVFIQKHGEGDPEHTVGRRPGFDIAECYDRVRRAFKEVVGVFPVTEETQKSFDATWRDRGEVVSFLTPYATLKDLKDEIAKDKVAFAKELAKQVNSQSPANKFAAQLIEEAQTELMNVAAERETYQSFVRDEVVTQQQFNGMLAGWDLRTKRANEMLNSNLMIL